METTRYSSLRKNVFLGTLATMMMFSFTSTATKSSFAVSSIDQKTRGYVKIKIDERKNYTVRVNITDLTELTKLQPPRLIYVVWMVSDQYETKNLGQLHWPQAAISNSRKVSFEAVTSVKPSKIFITAEDDATIQHPGVQVILATNRF